MPTYIKFIRAEHGDSILIEHEKEGSNLTILIDGGPTSAFRNRSTGRDGNLKIELDRLKEQRALIDLLIVTHIDSDHIGGLLEAFKIPAYLPTMAKQVWFNSASSIAERFSQEANKSHYINEDFSMSLETSIREAETFENFIGKLKIWDKDLIHKDLIPVIIDNLSIKILSPNMHSLEQLINHWKPYNSCVDLSNSGCSHDYSDSYEKLIEIDDFREDKSPTNGSSISLLIEIAEERILLLSDAHPTTVVNSLIDLGYSETFPLHCKLVKISHHGSKKNTNLELLKLIKTSCFVVTTNGSAHCLPNKTTLARIHLAHPEARILFNYPELIKKIYSPSEIIKLGKRIGPASEVIKIAD